MPSCQCGNGHFFLFYKASIYPFTQIFLAKKSENTEMFLAKKSGNTEMFAKSGLFWQEKATPFLVREWGY